MKKLLVILVIVGAGLTKSDAQSMLKVRMADNTPINVSVDGRYFNKTGTSVTVGDLPFGRHYFKIYTMAETRNGRRYEEIVYEGKIKTYYGRITSILYDPNTGGIDVQEQDIDNYANNQPPANEDNGQYTEQGSNDNNQKSYDQNNNGYTAPASPVAPDAISTMTDSKIDKLKTKVAGKNTDTEKMNMMKAGLQNETLTTAQVGALMDWLSFESSKVDFAEWAYNFTVDKEMFSDLSAKLNYQNYRDDLDKFLKAQK